MPEHQQTQQPKKTNTIFQKQATPISQTPASNPFSIIQRAKINPKSLTYADVMQLQRTIGNRAVGILLTGIGNTSTVQQAPVQRQEIPEEEETCPSCMQRQEIPEEEEPLQGKFENKPEQMTCPSCFAAPIVQKQELEDEEKPLQRKMIETVQRQEIPEEEEPLQGKMIETVQRQEIPEEEEPLQGKMKTVQRQEIPEEEEPLQTKRENNTGMPDNLKAGVENLSGIDMSNVRVHYNSDKPAKVGALAYTQGTDIHVAPGQERYLPHEAWYVVQQKQERVQATMQMKGLGINDDPSLEHEADMMGAETAQFVPAPDVEMLQGSDMHVGPGQEKHLPHETWHVVQQRMEKTATSARKGIAALNSKEILIRKSKKWNVNSSNEIANNVLQKKFKIDGIEYNSRTHHTHRRELMTELEKKIKGLGFNITKAAQNQVYFYINSDGEIIFKNLDELVSDLFKKELLYKSARGVNLGPRKLGERPSFKSSVLESVKIEPGEARRHVISSSSLGKAIEEAATSEIDLSTAKNHICEFLNRHGVTPKDKTLTEQGILANARQAWSIVHNHTGNLWAGPSPNNSVRGFIRGTFKSMRTSVSELKGRVKVKTIIEEAKNPAGPGMQRAIETGLWLSIVKEMGEVLSPLQDKDETVSKDEAISVLQEFELNSDLDLPQKDDKWFKENGKYLTEVINVYIQLTSAPKIKIFQKDEALDVFLKLSVR